MRSTLIGWGTIPSVSSAASVPRRGEKMNVKAPSKPTSSTTESVSSKSASVSPGNPTMMSVVRAQSGTCSRMSATRSR